MSGFEQKIDLFARLEPPKQKPMSLIYMGLGWTVLIIGYLAATGFLVNQERGLRTDVKLAKSRNQQLQQQISQRQQQDEQIDLAPMESRLSELRLQQQRYELLGQFLDESDLTEQQRFSEAMAGLARQHVPGIAIEKFALHGLGLSIQGQLGDPAALPIYVQRLGEEPVFSDVQFNKIVMTTINEQLNFEMSSSVPPGKRLMNYMMYLEKLEAISVREKVLIGCTVGALLVSILQFFMIDPRLVVHEQLTGQMRNLTSNNKRLELQLEGKLLMPKQNRRAVLNQEIELMTALLDEEQSAITTQTATLVPASQVADLLQSLLSRKSVELVALKNIAPVPILEVGAEQGESSVQLYKHGIELQLRGSYHELRRYLMAIEAQSWKLLWHAVHFETETDDQSLMRIELQTLSTDDVWLGV